jgi:hypothetical protein
VVLFFSQVVVEEVKKIKIKSKLAKNIDHQDLVFGKGL